LLFEAQYNIHIETRERKLKGLSVTGSVMIAIFLTSWPGVDSAKGIEYLTQEKGRLTSNTNCTIRSYIRKCVSDQSNSCF